MKKISSISYPYFEKTFLKMFNFQQYSDGRKDADYENSFKSLIKELYNYFTKETYKGKFREWLIEYYKDNKEGKNRIWLFNSSKEIPEPSLKLPKTK